MASTRSSASARATFAAVALIWCAPIISLAEVYRWVDANGNVHFSDQAGPGAVQIEVPPTTTITLPKPSEDFRPREATEKAPAYKKLEIAFPGNNSAFQSGNGDFTVTTNIEPSLSSIHELRLLLDGQVYATGRSGQFSMTNIERGSHSLQLQVVHNGEPIQSSADVVFTIHRPSLLNPNRPAAK